MDALECIKKRRSVRSFSNRVVPKDAIEKILEAGKSAPSAGGLESQRFFLADKQKDKEKLAEISFGQKFVADASHVIAVFADAEKTKARYGERGNFYTICDGAAAVENILLAATELGIGSVWVGKFDDGELKNFFKTSMKPIALIPLGYEK